MKIDFFLQKNKSFFELKLKLKLKKKNIIFNNKLKLNFFKNLIFWLQFCIYLLLFNKNIFFINYFLSFYYFNFKNFCIFTYLK